MCQERFTLHRISPGPQYAFIQLPSRTLCPKTQSGLRNSREEKTDFLCLVSHLTSVIFSTVNLDFSQVFLYYLFLFSGSHAQPFLIFSFLWSVSKLCILSFPAFPSCMLCPPLKSYVNSCTVFYCISSPKIFPMKSQQKICFNITIQRHCTSSPCQQLYFSHASIVDIKENKNNENPPLLCFTDKLSYFLPFVFQFL